MTEPFTGAVQAYIDDLNNTDLNEIGENYLRTQLEKLRAEHGLIEGADAHDLRRTIAKIVRRLLNIRSIGDHARALIHGPWRRTPRSRRTNQPASVF